MDQRRPIYRCLVHDSSRWEGFPFRAGDIVITTPPKCGTTWMQRICSLLVLQTTELDRSLTTISPWLDMTTLDRDDVFALLAAQEHRRFIKSHTPLDGLPVESQAQYICVGRDPRDVGVSWYHHQMNVDLEALLAAREKAVGNHDLADRLASDPPFTGKTLEERFWQWVDHPAHPRETGGSLWGTLQHIEEALRAQNRDNVHLFHYSDMKADLEGEMRRLAALLNISVDEVIWPELVDAASFESMKQKADQLAPALDAKIWKENTNFFYKGHGGGWREFFDDAAQARYDTRVAELVSPEVARWAHRS